MPQANYIYQLKCLFKADLPEAMPHTHIKLKQDSCPTECPNIINYGCGQLWQIAILDPQDKIMHKIQLVSLIKPTRTDKLIRGLLQSNLCHKKLMKARRVSLKKQ
jgi:hypothetical protein